MDTFSFENVTISLQFHFTSCLHGHNGKGEKKKREHLNTQSKVDRFENAIK